VIPGHRRRTVIALAVVLALASAVAAHYAIVTARSPTLGALLSLVPLAALGIAFARRAQHRALVIAAMALAVIAIGLGWGMLERNFAHLFFVEHAGANLFLAVMFGRTLAAGREPLCTRFARLLQGTLDDDERLYTRRVTLAWTLFFATIFTLSCALYLGGFLAEWSFLANIASPLLVAAMFVVEYAIRLRVLPGHVRTGVLGGIRAFSRHVDTARFEAPR
jgi:uncharacterized membrane protein